jgi:RHO1 GDP-GTP exchange protein 1/2
MDRQYAEGFCKEVFWNLDEILRHHQRMLAALFNRQREQHPLIQSIADVILDSELTLLTTSP